MPPNVPRSRRWNHDALTLTIDTAPKLWKYMFSANSSDRAPRPTARRRSPVAIMMPDEQRSSISAPPAAIRIVMRPPQRSVSGPLMRNERPYVERADELDRAEVLLR